MKSPKLKISFLALYLIFNTIGFSQTTFHNDKVTAVHFRIFVDKEKNQFFQNSTFYIYKNKLYSDVITLCRPVYKNQGDSIAKYLDLNVFYDIDSVLAFSKVKYFHTGIESIDSIITYQCVELNLEFLLLDCRIEKIDESLKDLYNTPFNSLFPTKLLNTVNYNKKIPKFIIEKLSNG